MSERANSFDDVRLLAALVVLVAHSPLAYGVGGSGIFIGPFFAGSLAVHIFFAISGYLIAQSWANDPDMARFLARRALRLLPALAVVVLSAMFLIGPVFTTLTVAGYFESTQTWRYLANIALVLTPRLPGVFEQQPEPQLGVNPPLWSLAYEATMYLGLMTASLFCRRAPRLVGPLLVGGLVVLAGSLLVLLQHAYYACLCFVVGWTLHQFKESIAWRPDIGFLVFAVFVLAPDNAEARLAAIAALSYTAVAFGRSHYRPLRFITRHGDISYGTYIWAYPVQRVVNELLGFQSHWALSLILCLSFTLPIAWMSWRYVERPALAIKPKRRPDQLPPDAAAAAASDQAPLGLKGTSSG
jgi:peptidoglycan/LPS O-acetylase OafA/YrhL